MNFNQAEELCFGTSALPFAGNIKYIHPMEKFSHEALMNCFNISSEKIKKKR